MKRVLIITLLAIGMLFCLCGCGINSYAYLYSDKYSAGSGDVPASEVNSLDIDWAAGSVDIVYTDGNTVEFTETCAKPLDESEQMHWYVNNGCLMIKYKAAKVGISFDLSLAMTPSKSLTVSLPRGLELDGLNIDVASTSVKGDDLMAKKASIDTASGSVALSFTSVEDIKLDTASGEVNVAAKCDINSIEVDTASGKVDVSVMNGSSLVTDTASGEVNISAGSFDLVNIDTSSGAVRTEFRAAPKKCRVDTASGKVVIALPDDAEFTADVDTASGDFTCEFPTTQSGGVYTCGSGSSSFSIDTASGDVSIVKM